MGAAKHKDPKGKIFFFSKNIWDIKLSFLKNDMELKNEIRALLYEGMVLSLLFQKIIDYNGQYPLIYSPHISNNLLTISQKHKH